jgi:hypothetical protein
MKTYLMRHHVALLALFFALGGTSFAAAGTLLPRNSVGTKQVVNGSLQTADLSKAARAGLRGERGPSGAAGPQGLPGQPATKLFVALDANGKLVKNSGATVAARRSTGVYRVGFDTDITKCVYLATAGQDSGSLFEDYHLYTSRTGTNTVDVQIFDEKNSPFDRAFYLAVFC